MTIDAAQVAVKVAARDLEVRLVLNSLSFSTLQLTEPSEETVQLALKESRAAQADPFKQNYERLQQLLKKMNHKLVEGDITPDTYKVLYKKFHAAIPQAWMYTLCCKNLERFWRDGEGFEKEEYLPEDKCQGISELQICLSNANALIEESKEVILDEDVIL